MTQNLFLKPDEAKFLAIAVVGMLEQIQDAAKNQKANWTPEARKDFKEMIVAGNSLKIKLTKLCFDTMDLPPFEETNWDEFFTKLS